MPSSVRMNGNATPNEAYVIGSVVALSNFDDTGVVSWAWTLLSKPAGSTAVLATPTASTSSFTADKEGSYRVRLVTNDGTSLAVARVKTTHVSLIPFAKDETSEGDATEGWAKAWRESYQLLDQRIGIPANRRTVRYVGTAASGPLVLTATGAVVTLPNGDIVPAVDRVSAGAGAPAVFLWDGGALATNQDIRVLAWGMSDLLANPDTMVANDPVYLGTTGLLVKTPPAADGAQLVGFCLLVNGGDVRVWFEPRPASNSVTMPVAVSAAAAASGSSRSFARADHSHSATTAIAATIVPDSANSAGSGSALALANHIHQIATSAVAPPAISAAGAAGTAGSVARGDHTHGHGNQLGGLTHSLASAVGSAGFMSVTDKDKSENAPDMNVLVNGGFAIWQRTALTTFAGTQSAIGTYDHAWNASYASPYTADRWYLQTKKLTSGSASFSVTMVIGSPTAGSASSPYGFALINNTASLDNHVYQVAQELAPRLSLVAGKRLAWAFKAKRGADVPASSDLVVEVWISTASFGATRFKDYTSPVLHSTTVISCGDLTTTEEVYSGLIPQIPANVTAAAFVIGFAQNGDGVGTSADRIFVTDVILSPTSSDTLGRVPAFVANSLKVDYDECEPFFRKSTPVFGRVPPANIADEFLYLPYTGNTAYPYASFALEGYSNPVMTGAPIVRIYADGAFNRVWDPVAAAYRDIDTIFGDPTESKYLRFTTTTFPGATGNPVAFNWCVEAEII